MRVGFALVLTVAFALTAARAQEVPDEAPAAPAAAPDWIAKPVAALPAPVGARTRLLSLAQAGSRLVAVGQQGVIVVSDDGKNWRQANSPVSQMLTRVRFRDDKNGWATGYDGVILATLDGGQNWTVQHLDASARPLYDILFLDDRRGIAVGGYGTYLVTADGGKTWAPQSSPLSELGLHFNRLAGLEDGSLFLTGEKGLMATSTDQGANWKMLKSPYAGSFFGALPLGGRKMLVYGMRGNVFVSEDIGKCPSQDPSGFDQFSAVSVTEPAKIAALGWRRLDNPSKESLYGAERLASGEALLIGFNGTAVVTDLAAGSVQMLKLPAEESLVDVRNFGGRLIGVGKRGAQDLGAAR